MSAGPVHTVGLFSRPDWRFGGEREFSPGEFVRVRTPIPSIVVQSIGGPLPCWATPSRFLDAEPDYELVIFRGDRGLIDAPQTLLERLGHIAPKYRILLHGPNGLPPATEELQRQVDMTVSVEREQMDTVAEAIAILATGSGFDGRALVLNGIGEDTAAPGLQAWIEDGQQAGYAGVVLMMQLVRPDEHERLMLVGFDAFAETALEPCDEVRMLKRKPPQVLV